MVTEIPLTRGYIALVDDEDAEVVMQFKWRSMIAPRRYGPSVIYAVRSVVFPRVDGRQRSITVYLHRFLMPGHRGIDHKDRDGLNNRRSNIRPSNQTLNNANQKPREFNKSSRFRGVTRCGDRDRWRAQIGVRRKQIFLGHFDDEESAARAYDAAAQKYFGEFASPNFQASS